MLKSNGAVLSKCKWKEDRIPYQAKLSFESIKWAYFQMCKIWESTTNDLSLKIHRRIFSKKQIVIRKFINNIGKYYGPQEKQSLILLKWIKMTEKGEGKLQSRATYVIEHNTQIKIFLTSQIAVWFYFYSENPLKLNCLTISTFS